jgi:hypothetical protein
MRSSSWTTAILILSLLIPGCSRTKSDKLSTQSTSTPSEETSTISSNEENAAYLMVYCDSKINPSLNLNVNVNVNKTLIGSVGSGTTKLWTFIPKPDGNSVVLETTNNKSSQISFQAQKGEVISISCDLKGDIENPEIVIKAEAKSNQLDLGQPKFSQLSSKQIPVSTDVVELLSGAKTKLKRLGTVEETVSLSNTQSLESSTKGELAFTLLEEFLEVNVEKARTTKSEQINQKTSKQLNTFEQEVELDGKVCQKYQITWYDKIKTGTVEFEKFKDKGKPRKIEFQIREGAAVKVEQRSSKMW